MGLQDYNGRIYPAIFIHNVEVAVSVRQGNTADFKTRGMKRKKEKLDIF